LSSLDLEQTIQVCSSEAKYLRFMTKDEGKMLERERGMVQD